VTDHADVLELAAQQIDFDLTPVEVARLDAHLAACVPCRVKVERLRADSTALRSFSWYDAPAKVEDVVLTAALHGRGRSAPRPWALGLAAALALVLLAGGALGGGTILERLLVGARPTSPAPSVPASADAPSVAPTAVQGGSPPPSAIGIAHLTLDPKVDYRQGDTFLMIFVETGSSSDGCLATLSEMWWDDLAPGPGSPANFFCAVRTPKIDGKVRHGVGLTIFFNGPVGEDFNLVFNVYQEGAKYYKAPVPCAVAWCGG
jgi:hypothetical protein